MLLTDVVAEHVPGCNMAFWRWAFDSVGGFDPEYRKAGLPVTSSLMESTVKQMNRRVKGSEKFWSEEGAEGILQLRADDLSDDKPLERFWEKRQAAASGQRRYRRSAG